MNKFNRYGLIVIASCALLSCQREELKAPDQKSDNEINLVVDTGKAIITRSAAEDNNISKRIFLGMADTDSLFLSVIEEDIPSEPATKADNVTVGPDAFNIVGFKDDSTEPYVKLKISSQDGWDTYSPKLYWPNYYDNIHFFAYTSNEANNLIAPIYSFEDGGYKATFDYTLPNQEGNNDAEIQPDIMFAIAPGNNQSSGAVNLNFYHTLSAVTFRLGRMGDAQVNEFEVSLSNILSKGRCTVTDPLSVQNIKWEQITTEDHYTQTFRDNESFMIIPQDLSELNASFTVSIKIGDKTHTFPAKSIKDLTPEWTSNKKYTYIVSNDGYVEASVDDHNTALIKSDLTIQNTGWTTSYIRAAIIGYWSLPFEETMDEQTVQGEEIVAFWDVTDESAGTLSKPDNWGDYWTNSLGDGFYYYKYPLAPGQSPTVPLFDSYAINNNKATGPVTGSKLNISISVQSIDYDDAQTSTLWPTSALHQTIEQK